jgi:hypothetical protein
VDSLLWFFSEKNIGKIDESENKSEPRKAVKNVIFLLNPSGCDTET